MSDTQPCKVCGQPLGEAEVVACGLCHVPHHRDCWEYTGLCSTYGCGGITTVPFSSALVPREVTIDENSHAPVPLSLRMQGLQRRFDARAGDIPVTLRAGAKAGALTCVAMVGSLAWFVGPAALLVPKILIMTAAYAGTLMGAGLLYGILAPFLAPYQHKYPLETTAVTGLLSVGSFALAVSSLGMLGVFFMPTVVFGVAAASTFAGALFGPYSRLGRKLGGLASPARYATTAAAFLICSLIAGQMAGFPLGVAELTEAMLWTVLATLAAGHSLETGQEEYRKHLIALAEKPAEDGPDGDG